MVTLFLSPSCTSCRKARAWLLKHEVNFQEHNIITSPLTRDELLSILSFTENGTEDIISTRSKVFQKLNIDVEDLSISDLIDLIASNPSLLRRPIIMDKKECKLVLTKMISEHFYQEITVNKNYVKQQLKQKLRDDMSTNYNYPLDINWSTDDITSVLHFLNQVELAYEGKVNAKNLLQAYSAFKKVVPSKAQENKLIVNLKKVVAILPIK
ncbi:regulatory protein Spx [Streptococcus parauberis KCTC 11537]|nr:regulatory protein Spx [Streptococcus parauberis KCTC 11537]